MTTTTRLQRAAAAAALGALLLGACSAGASSAAPDARASDDAVAPSGTGDRSLDAQDQARLDSLPACPPAPEADPTAVLPDHVLVPPGTILTSRVDTKPLIEVEAWTPTDPIRVRRFYQQGVLGALKPIQIEDEVVEAEALMEWPGGRFFVKAVALCPTASTLHLVVSQPGANAEVPSPAGSPPDDSDSAG